MNKSHINTFLAIVWLRWAQSPGEPESLQTNRAQQPLTKVAECPSSLGLNLLPKWLISELSTLLQITEL